jgi:HNH endonuclease
MLLHYGFTQAEIAFATDRSKSTIAYHMRNLGRTPDERFNRRYDWAEVQRFYDEGNSITACMTRLGFSRKTFNDARLRGDVVSRPQAMPLEQLLSGRRQRGHLKSRLIGLGFKEDRCELCGISEWRGAPLSLALHHVNGDGQDNRLENLQLLCPNCHSQTENFAGRNVRRIKEMRP